MGVSSTICIVEVPRTQLADRAERVIFLPSALNDLEFMQDIYAALALLILLVGHPSVLACQSSRSLHGCACEKWAELLCRCGESASGLR